MSHGCPVCSRSFGNPSALRMHMEATAHRPFFCSRCNRIFASQQDLDTHNSAKHQNVNAVHKKRKKAKPADNQYTLSIDSLEAPVDTPGMWLSRQEFNGEKSFGAFQCLKCKKTWISAHAFKAYKQGCQTCEREELPLYMWQNLRARHDQDIFYDEDNDEVNRPHDQQRCEACRRGVCSGRGGIGRLIY